MDYDYEVGSLARAYQVMAASVAGEEIGNFPNEAQANEFYRVTGGPSSFANKLYNNDKKLTSAFIGFFLLSLKKTGFTIWSANTVA